MAITTPVSPKNYVVGIDVGLYSVGLAAIEIDDEGFPVRTLNLQSAIHDAGIDPNQNKQAITRRKQAGIKRRTRRMFNQRRKRLKKLDAFIAKQGWPVPNLEDYPDPYYPWRVRAELASCQINDPAELGEKLAIALRHIARHRGWRNPYIRTQSLFIPAESDSDAFKTIKKHFTEELGISFAEDATVGQVINRACGAGKLRGSGGMICARLFQTDHVREIARICEIQNIDEELYKEIILQVFDAKSPKGSASRLVGKDPLPGQGDLPRALKASEAFQRYRIASIIANLRIKSAEGVRPLDISERKEVFNYLWNAKTRDSVSWNGVAQILNIDRGNLRGTATLTDDGERASARPPINDTDCIMRSCKIKPLVQLWKSSSGQVRAALIRELANGESTDDSQESHVVDEFLLELSDDELTQLESIHLPIGRAAYSEDSLIRLTERMMNTGEDLTAARCAEFNLPAAWEPPKPSIGEPTGNPAVDRTLKIVARWLDNVTARWGLPQRVTIEHVRDAFMSVERSRELDREMQKRHKRNENLFANMREQLGISGEFRRSDLWRFQSFQRQNGQCAYCGCEITFANSEMDHIVPRAGVGSTNTRDNLVAVCHECNLDKSNIPFRIWAEKCERPGVSLKEAIERVDDFWNPDNGLSAKQFNAFKKRVIERLSRSTEDEAIDNRSIESVAWMANELRARISHQYAGVMPDDERIRVQVFAGSITAEARKAAGIEKQLFLIGGPGKTRLDRRHHAVDAAVVALLSPGIAQTLAQRHSLRLQEQYENVPSTFQTFTGDSTRRQHAWDKWLQAMQRLVEILQTAVNEDQIPVTGNLRLRLGNSQVHEESIRELKHARVGDRMPASLIDRAASEALWCALTRHPDYSAKDGLPEDPTRSIRVNGKTLTADSKIDFFDGTAGAITIRGGYAELGKSFHHMRIYRIPMGKKIAYSMLRVYTVDLTKYRHTDLFAVALAPQSISVRQAEPKLRAALAAGTAEYLGWIVVNDEIVLDSSAISSPDITKMTEAIGPVTHWQVDGSDSPTRLRLRPRYLSAEGITEGLEDLTPIVAGKGWRIAINKLFSKCSPVVVRRNALGEVRWRSTGHLPVSWGVNQS